MRPQATSQIDLQYVMMIYDCVEGHIIVAVSLYTPNVLCYGSPAMTRLPEATQKLIDMIPTTSDELFFGPGGQPAVQVGVPKVFISRYGLPLFFPPSPLCLCFPFPRDGQEMADRQPALLGPIATVDTIRTTAKGTWLDLWAGAVAINAICMETMTRAGVAVLAQGLKISLTPGLSNGSAVS
ncbi:MAG: hypothetical protein Q9195_007271 [Heterodermia aff. obscurata]